MHSKVWHREISLREPETYATGGESAFGSRARLSAEERAEALGRGLAKEIGGLRSAGFQRAQQTAISEDERQKQAARAAASGLAGLSGQTIWCDYGTSWPGRTASTTKIYGWTKCRSTTQSAWATSGTS